MRRTLAFVVALLPALAAADSARPWVFRTRAVMSGNSDQSDPSGYKVYSGIAVEAALGRQLWGWLAAELSVRTESREVDVADPGHPDRRLGSIDLLPLALFVQARPPWWATVHPYAGAGVSLTPCWEKTGALDDMQLTPGLGPAVQLGVDVDVADYLFVDADLRWNLYRTDVSTQDGTKMATLKIDPLALAVGLGVRF